jgi:hypothetical protein
MTQNTTPAGFVQVPANEVVVGDIVKLAVNGVSWGVVERDTAGHEIIFRLRGHNTKRRPMTVTAFLEPTAKHSAHNTIYTHVFVDEVQHEEVTSGAKL